MNNSWLEDEVLVRLVGVDEDMAAVSRGKICRMASKCMVMQNARAV